EQAPRSRERPARRTRGFEGTSGGWYCQAKATKCGRTGDEKSERLVVPRSRGTRSSGPGGGKGASKQGTVEEKDAEDTGSRIKHLHETSTDSGAGAGNANARVDDTGPSHGPGLDARSVSAYAQGRGDRGGPPDGGRVCGEPGRQSPGAPRGGQERAVPS